MADQSFPKALRLLHTRQFGAVHAANVRTVAGPLVVWAVPNDVGHARLGLAVSRRVGTAPVRNRIKRLLRETFRRLPRELWPSSGGYDLVISVRHHHPMTLVRYEQELNKAIAALERAWSRKPKPNSRNG